MKTFLKFKEVKKKKESFSHIFKILKRFLKIKNYFQMTPKLIYI